MGLTSIKADKWYYSYLPNGIAGGAISPLIPLFVTQGLGGSVGHVGLVASASSIASVPSHIFWGSLSDSMKRRKIFVMIGFFGMALSLFLMSIASDIGQYYIANVLLGLLAAASAPVGTVLLIETTRKGDWAEKLGIFSKIGGLGGVFGLILGALWLQTELLGLETGRAMRALFVAAASLSFLSGILALKWIPEPERKIERKTINLVDIPLMIAERAKYLPSRIIHFVEVGSHLRLGKEVRQYFLSVFLFFTGFTAFYAVFPIFLVDAVGLTSGEVFLVYIASSATAALLYAKAGHWVKMQGGKRMQILATTARTILFPSFILFSILPIPHLATLSSLLVLHAMVGLSWAVISVSGCAIVSDLSPKEAKGKGMGAYNAIQGVGAILGALVGGLLAEFFGFFNSFVSASMFVFAGTLVLFKLASRSLK